MAVTHAAVATIADDGVSEVGKDEWNAAHSGVTTVATDVIFDAKGDEAIGTGADTSAKLTVGANGTTRMADSAQTTGQAWVAGAHPGNKGTLVSGAIAENLSRYSVLAANALASGQMRMALIWLPTCTVTSITWCSSTTALVLGTSPHLWAALYQSDLTFLKQSTDDTAGVWTASTAKTFTLTSTTAVTAGYYYTAVMCVAGGGGTMPTVQHLASLATTGIMASLPVLCGSSGSSLTTTAPTPAAAITVGANAPYCYVS